MTKLIMRVIVLSVVLFAAPVQSQSLKDAYLDIKKKLFKKEYKHLVLLPIVSTSSVELPDNMKQLILDRVIKKLTKSKIKLVLPKEVEVIRDQLTSLYPIDMSNENIAVIDEHTVRELFFRYPVDGLVSVQVLAVPAPFADDKAQWGGTSQKIKHRGDGFFGTIMGKDYGGHIVASAIRVVISNRKGAPVYNWMGGVEVMMQRNGKKLEALPISELWLKEKRVLKAVKYALKPL